MSPKLEDYKFRTFKWFLPQRKLELISYTLTLASRFQIWIINKFFCQTTHFLFSVAQPQQHAKRLQQRTSSRPRYATRRRSVLCQRTTGKTWRVPLFLRILIDFSLLLSPQFTLSLFLSLFPYFPFSAIVFINAYILPLCFYFLFGIIGDQTLRNIPR